MYQLFVLKCSTQCNSILTKEMTEIYQLTFSSCCGSCNKQPYIGLAATRAAFTGAASTGAAAGPDVAPPAKRLKPAVYASRSSARYAVVSKRKDRCLSGSSSLESPEKVREIEELNDSFRIE